jgi:hypothetical protein
VVATWEQLVAAGLAPAMPGVIDPGSMPAAGLARMALAGGGDRHGSCLSPATLARLACDGIWRRVIVSSTGIPIDVGRGQRLATAAQRTALAVRDGGCVIPGCGMPISWCDIHHHLTWSDGGATDLDNLYPLCGRHHTEVHSGVWQIEWVDGLPWVRPPRWVNRAQPLMRNTTHDARREAHTFGQQLALDVEAARTHWLPPAGDPPSTDPPTGDGGGGSGGGGRSSRGSSAAGVRQRNRGIMAPRARPPDRRGRPSPSSARRGHPPTFGRTSRPTGDDRLVDDRRGSVDRSSELGAERADAPDDTVRSLGEPGRRARQ